MSRRATAKLLVRLAYIADPRGTPPTYDARVVDFVRAARGQPHRPLEPAWNDWLTRYRKETHEQTD